MKSWQYRDLDPAKIVQVVVTKGKYKGQLGTAQKSIGSDLRVHFGQQPRPSSDDPRIIYRNVEFVDQLGRPIIEPVMDMTGREIELDTWLVYSVNANTSHALEIGKVTRISDVGGLTVQRLLRNGDAVVRGQRLSRDTRVLNDPWRTLKLPVETVTMTTWVLKDFDNLKYGDGL